MADSLLPLAIGFAVVAVLTMIGYNMYFKNKKFHCYALMYEHVGDEEVFIDVFKVFKVKTSTITCLKINSFEGSFIDMPISNDYFQSKKYGKVLHIVKFGENDFRIKKRLEDVYYREVEKLVYEEEEILDDNGEVEEIALIPKEDEEGNLIYEMVKEPYVVPLGIDQEAMDAIRTSMQNEEEINKELKKEGFWDKYGSLIVSVGSILMCVLLLMKTSGDIKESSKYITDECSKSAKMAQDASKAINEPTWAEQVMTWVDNRNKEKENAPPPK